MLFRGVSGAWCEPGSHFPVNSQERGQWVEEGKTPSPTPHLGHLPYHTLIPSHQQLEGELGTVAWDTGKAVQFPSSVLLRGPASVDLTAKPHSAPAYLLIPACLCPHWTKPISALWSSLLFHILFLLFPLPTVAMPSQGLIELLLLFLSHRTRGTLATAVIYFFF